YFHVTGVQTCALPILAAFLAAYKVTIDDVGFTETPLVVEAYDVEADTTFVVNNTTDGWQKFYFALINEYNSGTTYNLNDVVYYPSTGLLYRAITSSFSGVNPTNTSNWIAVTYEQVIATLGTNDEPGNMPYQILQTVLSFASRQCLDDAVIKSAKDGCCDGCSDSKTESIVKKLRTLT